MNSKSSLFNINVLQRFVDQASFMSLPDSDNIGEVIARQTLPGSGNLSLQKMRTNAVINRVKSDLQLKDGEDVSVDYLNSIKPDVLPALVENGYWRLAAELCRKRLLDFPTQLLCIVSGIRDCMVLWYIRLIALIQLGYVDTAASELEKLGLDLTAPLAGSEYDPQTYKAAVRSTPASPAFPEDVRLDWEAAFLASDSLVLWELEWLKVALPTFAKTTDPQQLQSAIVKSFQLVNRCKKFYGALCALSCGPELQTRLEFKCQQWKARELRLYAFIAGLLVQLNQTKCAENLLTEVLHSDLQTSRLEHVFARIELYGALLKTSLELANVPKARWALQQIEHLHKTLRESFPGQSFLPVEQYLLGQKALVELFVEDFALASSLLTTLLKEAASSHKLDAIGVNNFGLLQLQLGNALKAQQVLLASYIEKHPVAVFVRGGDGGETMVGNAASILDLTVGKLEKVSEKKRQFLYFVKDVASTKAPFAAPEKRVSLGLASEYANEGFSVSKLLLSSFINNAESPTI